MVWALRAFQINMFVIIHMKKKSNINVFYHLTSKLFFEHAILCFLSIFFHILDFGCILFEA